MDFTSLGRKDTEAGMPDQLPKSNTGKYLRELLSPDVWIGPRGFADDVFSVQFSNKIRFCKISKLGKNSGGELKCINDWG